MRAEAAFLQGRFTDAQIALERAYAQIEGNGQENMALCCDFLELRLSLCTEAALRQSMEERRAQLLRQHNAAWLNLWDAACAYYAALLMQEARIPPLFAEHRLSSVHFLAPGKPMMEMIENQVYLAQGAYAKVIGRSEGQLAVCAAMHYALVGLHVRIQTAAAYAMLGKRTEAQALLEQAAQDGLYGFQEVLTRSQARERYQLDGDFSFIVETDGYSAFSDDARRPILAEVDLTDYRYGRATHGYQPEKGPQPVFYARGAAFRDGASLDTAQIIDIAPTLAAALGLDLREAQGRVLTELLQK